MNSPEFWLKLNENIPKSSTNLWSGQTEGDTSSVSYIYFNTQLDKIPTLGNFVVAVWQVVDGGSENFRHSLTGAQLYITEGGPSEYLGTQIPSQAGDGHPPVLLGLSSDNSVGLGLVLDQAGGGGGGGDGGGGGGRGGGCSVGSLIGIGPSPSSI